MSIAAVQARMAELQSAITAVSRPVAAPPAAVARTSADFGGALATALATEGVTGTPGVSSVAAALTGGVPGGVPGAVPGGASLAGLTAAAAAATGPAAPSAGLAAPGAGPAASAVTERAATGSTATATGSASASATSPAATGSSAPGASRPAATGARSDAPSRPAGAGTGAALVESAKKYLGVPYVWGGERLSEGGLDCSGLVQLAMKDIGVDVPRVVRQQMRIGTEVPSLDQARPGDLVVTRGGGHIGIYVGDNKWIHAPYPGEKVKLAEMTAKPTTIRRVLPAA